MSTGMRKWMEKDCPDIPFLPAEVSIDREELRQLREELAQYKNERDELRARIEEMEKQEPVGIAGSMPGTSGFTVACFSADEVPVGTKLYALPGAQPTPSVPTALLVAVADLVAQMEIVSRVGYVDMPDDTDSCASFCVAEGTWLELCSCVESLASAIAAAPKQEETK